MNSSKKRPQNNVRGGAKANYFRHCLEAKCVAIILTTVDRTYSLLSKLRLIFKIQIFVY